MFYSTELLSVKSNSGLSVVWLAATLGSRSQTRKLSKRDYASVDIRKACEYVAAPPQPLSLRLASNLMIGITRVYGQQCQIYYTEAQTFWTSLVQSQAKKTVQTTVSTKAIKETITLPTGADLSLDGEVLLSGLLDDLLATPEEPRRLSSKSFSSRVPSIEPRSSNILPFDPSISPSPMIPWEDGFWDSSGEILPNKTDSHLDPSDFKHSLWPEMEVPSQLDVNNVTAPQERGAKRARKEKTYSPIFDKETILSRSEMLLEGEEGLLPIVPACEEEIEDWMQIFMDAHNQPKGRKKKSTARVSNETEIHLGNDINDDFNIPMEEPFGARITSSSLLPPASPIGLRSSLASLSKNEGCPIADNWDLASKLSSRRDSLDFYGTILLQLRGQESVTFQGICKGYGRAEASRNFYHILTLATTASLRVHQRSPFSPINIKLFENVA